MAKMKKPEVRTESPVVSKTTTPVRGTPIPKAAPAAPAARVITHEMIAKRAYEISTSGTGGSELENWLRAERELRGA